VKSGQVVPSTITLSETASASESGTPNPSPSTGGAASLTPSSMLFAGIAAGLVGFFA
jgi:hypothetical protein